MTPRKEWMIIIIFNNWKSPLSPSPLHSRGIGAGRWLSLGSGWFTGITCPAGLDRCDPVLTFDIDWLLCIFSLTVPRLPRPAPVPFPFYLQSGLHINFPPFLETSTFRCYSIISFLRLLPFWPTFRLIFLYQLNLCLLFFLTIFTYLSSSALLIQTHSPPISDLILNLHLFSIIVLIN